MAFRLQLRRDTTSKWVLNNPVLLDGEIGYEQDSSKIKIGDGNTPWIYLPYWNGGIGNPGATGPAGATGATGPSGGGTASCCPADNPCTVDLLTFMGSRPKKDPNCYIGNGMLGVGFQYL